MYTFSPFNYFYKYFQYFNHSFQNYGAPLSCITLLLNLQQYQYSACNTGEHMCRYCYFPISPMVVKIIFYLAFADRT